MGNDRKICVGMIAGAHGIRGLVRLRSFTEDPEAIASYGPLTDESGEHEFVVKLVDVHRSSRVGAPCPDSPAESAGTRNSAPNPELRKFKKAKDHFTASVEGIKDRDAAEELHGTRLYAARSQMPKTKKKEYYAGDLIGLSVQDSKNGECGKVMDIHDHGAGVFLEIGTSKRDSFMLPFTNAYVPEVDIDNGIVRVEVPEGWRANAAPGEKRHAREGGHPSPERAQNGKRQQKKMDPRLRGGDR